VTDRDIVVKVVARAKNETKVLIGELVGDGEVFTIGADDSAEERSRR
jgi:hypothetical protein